MALNVYNTKSRSLEEFKPITPNKVGMYTCGPTVYNTAHIGNLRSFIVADTIKRVLSYLGNSVDHVMNITDVDDKTIRDSHAKGTPLKEFTDIYTKEFLNDLKSLGCITPSHIVRATEHIPQMIALIEKLIAGGYAYVADDGSVYFSIHKDEKYGQLSPINKIKKKENAEGRIKTDEYEKETADDFALWKAWDEEDGDVYWESPWGKGRPGWHIECSAMSMEYLGNHFDVHTGGVDLIFPHHENEIAQSECATGETFVNYWLHSEWLLVDGKKMAKRDGNFITLKELKSKGVSPLGFRLWTLMGHYRSTINFVWETVIGTEHALRRLYDAVQTLPEGGTVSPSYQSHFKEIIENDFDTPRALALFWEIAKDENVAPADKRATLVNFDTVLGLGLTSISTSPIPQEVQTLIEAREQARQEKDWGKADELRADIESKGYTVKDTDFGPQAFKRGLQ